MRRQVDVVSLSNRLAVANRHSLVIGLASVVCLALLYAGIARTRPIVRAFAAYLIEQGPHD